MQPQQPQERPGPQAIAPLHGTQIIGGRLGAAGMVPAERSFAASDPATGEVLGPPFAEATGAEIDQAVTLAEEAAADLRRLPAAERAEFLREIGRRIVALGDALISRCAAETGLPVPRLHAERARTVWQLELMAGVVEEGSWVEARIDRAMPDRRPMPRPDLRRMLVPLGPVAVFGASNFPLAFSAAGGDTASALAAGNPVVVKAHPAHPGTSEMVGLAVAAAARDRGLPAGTFALLHGPRPDVGLALVRHPLLRAVGFTGSLKAGRALFDAAAGRPEPIPVYAEMGSTNPVFILPGALAERADLAAAGLLQSVTGGVGQFCTKPGLVVLPAGAGAAGDPADAFLRKTADLLATVAPGTMLHAGIAKAYGEGVNRLRSTGGVLMLARGATAGGAGAGAAGACSAPAALLRTDAATFLDRPHLSEEVFGPATLAVTCGSREELLEVARHLRGHLTGTVHGTEADLREYRDLIDVLATKVGRLIINGFPTGVEVSHAMNHGGPYPATTDARSTSVGSAAITRFARPLCYQDVPPALLPEELRDENPRGIWRLIDGAWTREGV